MEHFLDILILAIIVVGAGLYLFRVFKKARKNCGSICSGCSGSCQTSIKEFKNNPSIIPINKIN